MIRLAGKDLPEGGAGGVAVQLSQRVPAPGQRGQLLRIPGVMSFLPCRDRLWAHDLDQQQATDKRCEAGAEVGEQWIAEQGKGSEGRHGQGQQGVGRH